MHDSTLPELQSRLEAVTTRLLLPLRASKTLDEVALGELHSVLDGFAALFSEAHSVPRSLVGNLWFVFTSMLAEAEHARDTQARATIEAAAWSVEDRLRRIFGPRF